MNHTDKNNKFYSGWAMDAYPEMSTREMAHHVRRQIELGANYIWIGHNNPGEVDASKIEPGLSYAVWEAYEDDKDPRHLDAVSIIMSQHRLLETCLLENIPVVLPIGYQIQMGSRWNKENPDCLRRLPDGGIINWGGVSACFYAPQYQEDILRYYRWIVDKFVEPYRSILLMINLSDEPFGGDYSRYAEVEFKKKTGLGFQEALNGSKDALYSLGEFQSYYIVEYASWSARAWHSICPDIPSTMSFCGHHGREENTMPSVPELFRNTPSYFHPTFDVYPRDGNQATPIKEPDVIMLAVFLRQLAYLSRMHEKPYWLWTTGNSWGLGQASADRANITDAVVNQIMAVAGALETGANLRGLAVWNYNVKQQGLYNDAIETAYDTEDMFQKLTRVIGRLRDFTGKNYIKPPQLAIVSDCFFAHDFIARSKACTWIKPFAFDKFIHPAKQNLPLVMDDRLASIIQFSKKCAIPLPPFLVYLSSGEENLDPDEKNALLYYLSSSRRILLPRKLWQQLQDKDTIVADVLYYDGTPGQIPEEMFDAFFQKKTNNTDDFFHITLEDFEIVYNLSQRKQSLTISPAFSRRRCFLLSQSADLKKEVNLGGGKRNGLQLDHHEAALITPPDSQNFGILLDALKIQR
jgi:hypothetical protein